jgi:hypothetical protein
MLAVSSAFAGAGDCSLIFCTVGMEQPVTRVERAHVSTIMGVDFHPNGHMLASCESLLSWVRLQLQVRW